MLCLKGCFRFKHERMLRFIKEVLGVGCAMLNSSGPCQTAIDAMLLSLAKSFPDTLFLCKPIILAAALTTVYFLSPRFWDLVSPERSYVVAGSASPPSVSYYKKIIEGTEVVQVWDLVSSNTVGPKMALTRIDN